MSNWDPSKHPRVGKGDPQGGEFKGSGSQSPPVKRLLKNAFSGLSDSEVADLAAKGPPGAQRPAKAELVRRGAATADADFDSRGSRPAPRQSPFGAASQAQATAAFKTYERHAAAISKGSSDLKAKLAKFKPGVTGASHADVLRDLRIRGVGNIHKRKP